MTRINLVPPEELYDQHLFAEFREIKMVPKSLARSLRARGADGVLRMVPAAFTLNTGHVSFFYNKGEYLLWRYIALKLELSKRSFRFDYTSPLDLDNVYTAAGPLFQKDYEPTAEALALVRARIAERVALQPEWYRHTGRAR